eukprot:1382713-Ditylum_brightwellii.AAC.1
MWSVVRHSFYLLITPDNQKGKGKGKEPHHHKEIDLTESESASKAEFTKDNRDDKVIIDNPILEALAKLKPMALLRKIGSLHNHLAIETAILKDQKDRIHEAIFDDAKEL